MKRNATKLAPAIALALCATASAVTWDITPSEKDKTSSYLADTRNALVDAVKGLSEAQWKFKPAPDRWSAAEVVGENVSVLMPTPCRIST